MKAMWLPPQDNSSVPHPSVPCRYDLYSLRLTSNGVWSVRTNAPGGMRKGRGEGCSDCFMGSSPTPAPNNSCRPGREIKRRRFCHEYGGHVAAH
ncbi:hypothetical protein TNCT_311001 [Trichonephila clavata]|uniref:Uncharacterized protein n=1 Tax=Trichonephila clavata TaxID=2740835 RepID=A0A8X6H328_TRICU|nr:hypothetical protein TNCT_311001 [Trichonephila clavata]